MKQKFIAVRRLRGKRQRGCAIQGKRSTPFSTDEIAHQTKFAAVAASARLRMQDPSKITADQEGFREQSKYKTMYQYVFNLEWEAYQA